MLGRIIEVITVNIIFMKKRILISVLYFIGVAFVYIVFYTTKDKADRGNIGLFRNIGSWFLSIFNI